MLKHEYFDKQLNPITQDEWLKLCDDEDYSVVSRRHFTDKTIVCRWSGLAQNYGPSGPLVFQTVIIDHNGDRVFTSEHATVEQALDHYIALLDIEKPEEKQPRLWKILNEDENDGNK